MYHLPLVSIIVPTRNSCHGLENLISSLKNQTYKNIEVVINDSLDTTDKTPELISKNKNALDIVFIKENKSMAQARLAGSRKSRGEIVIHLDSDMILSRDVINECVNQLDKGYDALYIPEVSIGTTFWAKCKSLEKKIYEGNTNIESTRCFRRNAYFGVGGHDPEMIFSEDKDLDIRIRNEGYKVGRISSYIEHDEGKLTLLQTSIKKLKYSHTASLFSLKHPTEYKWQSNILARYWLFIRSANLWYNKPHIFIGMIIMKTSEYAFAFIGLSIHRMRIYQKSL